MLSRTILIAAAAGALSGTPVFAQQPKPVQQVASVSRDTTHVMKHTRRTTKARTNAATAAKPATPANPTVAPAQPATPATPAVKSQKTPVKHKTVKHRTNKAKKTTADTTKKS